MEGNRTLDYCRVLQYVTLASVPDTMPDSQTSYEIAIANRTLNLSQPE